MPTILNENSSSQDLPPFRLVVTIFFRKDSNIWEMRDVIGLDQEIQLQSMDSGIRMADLYGNGEFG
ncbi:MAG: hypothetical protein AAF206_13295 [Bacteroidota bacterium]